MARRLQSVDYALLDDPSSWFGRKAFGDDKDLASLQKYMPAYRDSLSRMTTKTGSRLTAFAEGSFNANAKAVRTFFEGKTTSAEMNDAISDFSTMYKDGIGTLEKSFDKASRNKLFDDEDKRDIAGKPVLRSRFFLAGADTIKETVETSVSDVVQGDLFAWQTSNEETGIFNSVYLDNKRHDLLMSQDCGAPRPPQQLEQLLFGHDVPEQYNDQQPIDSILYDMIKQDVVSAGLMGAGPVSVGLADQHVEADPFGLSATRETYLRNANTLSNGMQLEPFGVPFGAPDVRGMRRTGGYEDWCHPLGRVDNQIHVIERPQDVIFREEQGVGFDVLF
jgi:hypothetical protein